MAQIGQSVPASQFGAGQARLASTSAAARRAKMEASGPRLREVIGTHIYRGVLTGLNEAFIIDRATRDRLIDEDPRSAEILKPLLRGDDVRRYESQFREQYLVWTYIGLPMRRYPAVFRHLQRFQADAEARCDQGDHWWELRACVYYAAFEVPKILYPEIAREARFTLDNSATFVNNKVFLIPDGTHYLIGVLNSAPAWDWFGRACSALGDEGAGGRLMMQAIFFDTIPIPAASDSDRALVGGLAEQAQALHARRRERVEAFLRALGTSPAQSSSKNVLEQPWTLTEARFGAQARIKHLAPDEALFREVHGATAELTDQITRIEAEIDERVAGLYGL
ncbi:MAG: hypothetical protein HYU66_15965 [Armatimonadetes bacterium]|nr:hypothetical protein [Armatimonadota bacterium]